MNLRILKKLSKRAAPLLPLLGDHRMPFPARAGENYTGLRIMDRTHWERGRSVHADVLWDHEIKTPARDGKGWVYAHPPWHPRKGTVMVGAVAGYYEPEWSEETAWEALRRQVAIAFTDWDEGPCRLLRPLDTPSDVFRAARDLIAASTQGGEG